MNSKADVRVVELNASLARLKMNPAVNANLIRKVQRQLRKLEN